MSGDQEEQRRITRLALEAVGDDAGFALAGSGAIREHGLIDRPTEDVDLFTVQQAQARFGTSLDRIIAALRAAGEGELQDLDVALFPLGSRFGDQRAGGGDLLAHLLRLGAQRVGAGAPGAG